MVGGRLNIGSLNSARRLHTIPIRNQAQLRQRFQTCCGPDLNRNLLYLEGQI